MFHVRPTDRPVTKVTKGAQEGLALLENYTSPLENVLDIVKIYWT